MGILDDMKPPAVVTSCRVRTVADSLDESDRKIFYDALNDPRWSNRALASAMSDRGFELGVSSVQKHKSKVCSCSKI